MRLIYLLMAGVVLLSFMLAFLSGPFAVCVSADDAVKCDVYGGAGVPRHLEIHANGSFYMLYDGREFRGVFRCVNCNQSSVQVPLDVRAVVVVRPPVAAEIVRVYQLSALAVYLLTIPLALNVLAVVKALQGRLYGLYKGLKYAVWSSFVAIAVAIALWPLNPASALLLGAYGAVMLMSAWQVNRRLRQWVDTLLTR